MNWMSDIADRIAELVADQLGADRDKVTPMPIYL